MGRFTLATLLEFVGWAAVACANLAYAVHHPLESGDGIWLYWGLVVRIAVLGCVGAGIGCLLGKRFTYMGAAIAIGVTWTMIRFDFFL